MTKKDYIKIAKILQQYTHHGVNEEGKFINCIVEDFVLLLSSDNPNFDRDKFISYINQ